MDFTAITALITAIGIAISNLIIALRTNKTIKTTHAIRNEKLDALQYSVNAVHTNISNLKSIVQPPVNPPKQ